VEGGGRGGGGGELKLQMVRNSLQCACPWYPLRVSQFGVPLGREGGDGWGRGCEWGGGGGGGGAVSWGFWG
jgi:hypothetical protein